MSDLIDALIQRSAGDSLDETAPTKRSLRVGQRGLLCDLASTKCSY